jgi:Fic family protein
VRADLVGERSPGRRVAISGSDPRFGSWEHVAYVPEPLPDATPSLAPATFADVADARAALATLDAFARQLPNPALLRRPTLRREAQSTSALEGTFAPLEAVLAADDTTGTGSGSLGEVLNYVRAAEHAFTAASEHGLSLTTVLEAHALLVRGTSADGAQAGRVRSIQVAIGSGHGSRVEDARFVPPPPGPDLEAGLRDLLEWITAARQPRIDPVVAAAMAHYQLETLHPFNDGNGRLGRLLVVLQLMSSGTLREPTLTISPWFEARRADYYDRLLAVSTDADWDGWVSFFARGVQASAESTGALLNDLLTAQEDLKRTIRQAGLRSERASALVDYCLQQPIFTVPRVRDHLGLSYARTNTLVGQLVALGVLRQYGDGGYGREFTAPRVLAVLLRSY